MSTIFALTDLINIINRSNLQGIDIGIRGRVIAAGMAIAISRKVALPSSPVEDMVSHYRTSIFPEVRETINGFNEKYIVDTAFIEDLILKFYQIRYHMAFSDVKIISDKSENFFNQYTLVNFYFSQADEDFLNKNKEIIVYLTNSFIEVFNRNKQ